MMHCRVVSEPHCSDPEAEAKLRERRPTAVNTDELLTLMEGTRTVRRSWICSEAPTISDILKRYPRLADMPKAVCVVQCAHCVVRFESVTTANRFVNLCKTKPQISSV